MLRPSNSTAPAEGSHEPGHHPARGGLARSVRPEIADHLSRPHDEADIVDDLDAVEPFDEMPRFEKGSGHDGTPVQ